MIDDKGQVFLNTEFIADATDQGQNLPRSKPATQDPKFVVKGGDEVIYQDVVKVLDALQQLDIKTVGLATQ